MGLFSGIKHFFSSTVGAVVSLVSSIGSYIAFAMGQPEIGFVLLAVSVASSVLSQPEVPKLDSYIADEGYLVNNVAKIKEPIPVVYGTAKVGGNIVFLKTAGDNHKYLYQVITLSEGVCGLPKNVYFDDKPVNVVEKELVNNSSQYSVIVNPNTTNLKVHLKVKIKTSYKKPIHTCKFDEWGNIDCGYEIIEVPIIVNAEGNAVINDGDIDKVISLTARVPSYSSLFDELFYTPTNFNVAYASLYTNANGEKQLDIKVYNSDITIDDVQLIEYSTDGGSTWNAMGTKFTDYFELIYFDGQDLWRYAKTNYDITQPLLAGAPSTVKENGWIKIDSTDGMFRDFINQGFLKLGTDYAGALTKLRNNKVALLMARLKYNRDIWKNVPKINVLLQGVKRLSYDGSFKVIDNPVDILKDYLTNITYGVRINSAKIDYESFNKAFTYCEAKNFKFNGVLTADKTLNVIKNILNHFRGELIYSNGMYYLRVKDFDYEIANNLHYPNVVEIEAGNDSVQIQYPDLFTFYDQVEVQFINPAIGYKTDVVRIPEDVEDDLGRVPNKMTITLQGCDKETAQVLGTYYLERSRLGQTISFTTDFRYLDLNEGQLFMLSAPEYGIEKQWCRVVSKRVSPNGLITFSAVSEKPELYNDTYEQNIYDIDVTKFDNPIDLSYDQSFIGNVKFFVKTYQNEIASYPEKDIVISDGLLSLLPLSKLHMANFSSVYGIDDNEALGDGDIILFNEQGQLKSLNTANFHYGYGVSITSDKVYVSEYPYTSSTTCGALWEGRKWIITKQGIISNWDIPFEPTASFQVLENGCVIGGRIKVDKDTDADGNCVITAIHYRGNYYNQLTKLMVNDFDYDIYPKVGDKFFVHTFGWGEKGDSTFYSIYAGSIFYSYSNNVWYYANWYDSKANGDTSGWVDITASMGDYPLGFSFEFIKGNEGYLYYVNRYRYLVKLYVSSDGTFSKTILYKTEVTNPIISWTYKFGDFTYFMTEDKKLYRFNRNTEKIERIYLD